MCQTKQKNYVTILQIPMATPNFLQLKHDYGLNCILANMLPIVFLEANHH